MDRDEDTSLPPHGHVTSISVLRTYRRLGIANKLMLQAQRAMRETYKAQYISLHVRRTNRAALGLYRDTLGFTVKDIEKGYYADGEDAYYMSCASDLTARRAERLPEQVHVLIAFVVSQVTCDDKATPCHNTETSMFRQRYPCRYSRLLHASN